MNLLVNKSEMERWLAQPGTQAFLQFLKDRQLQLAMAWASGNPMDQVAQSQAETLGDLSRLEAVDVADFYGVEVIGDEQQRD